MTVSKFRSAIWTPGWYELDQSLIVGELQKYWFFQHPPRSVFGDDSDEQGDELDHLIFYNQLDSDSNCVVLYARIVEMVHPQLGNLIRVDTDGLDYIFFPIDGGEVVVNAEEEPGKVYDADLNISDWSVFVKLADVSQPIVNTA